MYVKFHQYGLSFARVIVLKSISLFHKINHNQATTYQNVMKLKLNIYQYNIAMYIKFC